MVAQVVFLFVRKLPLVGGHYFPVSGNVIAELMADDHIALTPKK